MEIKGEKVILVPVSPEEKDEFYALATQTEGSKFWYGEQGRNKQSKEEFFDDWNERYFDIASPEQGQCFWIVVDGEKVGQVNYNKIDLENKKVELDIIIGDAGKMGRGYGTDALKTLIKYLFDNFELNKIWIEASASNFRAINAYEGVGFQIEGILRQEDYFEGKFEDAIRFGILKSEI